MSRLGALSASETLSHRQWWPSRGRERGYRRAVHLRSSVAKSVRGHAPNGSHLIDEHDGENGLVDVLGFTAEQERGGLPRTCDTQERVGVSTAELTGIPGFASE